MRGVRDQQTRDLRAELSALVRQLGPDNGLVVRRQTRAADDRADDLLDRLRNGDADAAVEPLTVPGATGPDGGPAYRFMWDQSSWGSGDLWGE